MAEPYRATARAWLPQGVETWGSEPTVTLPSAQGGAPAWQRWSQVGLGHATYAGFNWCFDHVLYVLVVYHYGMFHGGALMTALSCLQCAATLVIYQRMRIDWVGAGLLAQLGAKPNPSRIERLLLPMSRWSPTAVFVALCLLQDPFIATAYRRAGRFGALTRRDWQHFLVAVLISNLYWILVASALGKLLAAAWHLLSNG